MNALALDNAVEINLAEAIRLIESAGNRFFRVDFIKRSTNSKRQMVARLGVKPKNPGNGRSIDPSDHDLIPVWEPPLFSNTGDDRPHDKRYRFISKERILALKVGGVTYKVVKK